MVPQYGGVVRGERFRARKIIDGVAVQPCAGQQTAGMRRKFRRVRFEFGGASAMLDSAINFTGDRKRAACMAVARGPARAAFEESLVSRCRGSVLPAIAEAPGAEIGDRRARRRKVESGISAGGRVCVLMAIVKRLAKTAIERGPLDGRDPGLGQFGEARLELARGDGALQPPGI